MALPQILKYLTKFYIILLHPQVQGVPHKQDGHLVWTGLKLPRKGFENFPLVLLKQQISPQACPQPANFPQVALNQQSSYCGHCDLVSLLYPSLSTATSYDADAKVMKVKVNMNVI